MGFVIIANNANWECHFLRQIFFQKNNLIHNFAYRFAIIFVPKTLQTTAVQLCTKKHSNVSMNNLNIWRVNQNVLHLPLMGFIARKLDILHLTDLSTFCTRLHASIGFITRKLGVFFTNQAKLWKPSPRNNFDDLLSNFAVSSPILFASLENFTHPCYSHSTFWMKFWWNIL